MEVKLTPDQQFLLGILRYDADEGLLYWRERRSQRVMAGDPAGSLHPAGYHTVKMNGTTFMAHRIIWKMAHGTDVEQHIDHIDGDRSNNRLSNLRLATPSQNCQNRRGKGKASKGAHLDGDRWRAQIQVDGKKRMLGSFRSEIEAHLAYCAAAALAFGEFASVRKLALNGSKTPSE